MSVKLEICNSFVQCKLFLPVTSDQVGACAGQVSGLTSCGVKCYTPTLAIKFSAYNQI